MATSKFGRIQKIASMTFPNIGLRVWHRALRKHQTYGHGCTIKTADGQNLQNETEWWSPCPNCLSKIIVSRTKRRNQTGGRRNKELQDNNWKVCPDLAKWICTSSPSKTFGTRHTGTDGVYYSAKSRQQMFLCSSRGQTAKKVNLIRRWWTTRRGVASERRVTAIRMRCA